MLSLATFSFFSLFNVEAVHHLFSSIMIPLAGVATPWT
jgi:hypothetical protein